MNDIPLSKSILRSTAGLFEGVKEYLYQDVLDETYYFFLSRILYGTNHWVVVSYPMLYRYPPMVTIIVDGR